MSQFLRITKAELIKLFKGKAIYIVAALLVVTMIAAAIVETREIDTGLAAQWRVEVSDAEFIAVIFMGESWIIREEASLELNMSPSDRAHRRMEIERMRDGLAILRLIRERGIPLYTYGRPGTFWIDGLTVEGYRLDSPIPIGFWLMGEWDWVLDFPSLDLPGNMTPGMGFDIRGDLAERLDFTMLFRMLFGFFCIVITIIVISGEFYGKTVKLLMVRPASRAKIMGAKLLAVFGTITLLWLIGAAVFAGLGSALGGMPMIAVMGSRAVVLSPFMQYTFIMLDFLFFGLAWAAFGSFFAVVFKNKIVALLAPYGMQLAFAILGVMLPFSAVLDISLNAVLFERLISGAVSAGASNFILAFVISLLLAALFAALAIRRFRKYDFDKAASKNEN